MVNCLIELLRCGVVIPFLRSLWGSFRGTLGPENPLYNLDWSRAESLVGIVFDFTIRVFSLIRELGGNFFVSVAAERV